MSDGKTDSETESPPNEDTETDKSSTEIKNADIALVDQQVTYRTLQTLINTPTVPNRYKESETGVDDMLAAVMVGKEIGIGPMQAINDLYLVNGQVSMSGKLMSAKVHQAGHAIHLDVTAKKAVATAYRRDPYTHKLVEMGSVEFTDADAKRAGLDTKGTYIKYPGIMKGWRAISNLCRVYFADALAGIAYVPEELDIDAPIEAIPDVVELEVEGEAVLEQGMATVTEQIDVAEVIDVPVPKKKQRVTKKKKQTSDG
jgi:hypothetical protein